jgi:hypothetical protein
MKIFSQKEGDIHRNSVEGVKNMVYGWLGGKVKSFYYRVEQWCYYPLSCVNLLTCELNSDGLWRFGFSSEYVVKT